MLQNDLQGILKKFDDFSKQVSGSNKRHSPLFTSDFDGFFTTSNDFWLFFGAFD